MTRVYVPTTRDGLADLHATGRLTGGERVVAPDADEESEYDALMTAAVLAAGLGGPDGSSAPSRRRVVVVAELAGEDDPVSLADVVAVHADPADRPEGADPDDDLAWFATQEIADLL